MISTCFWKIFNDFEQVLMILSMFLNKNIMLEYQKYCSGAHLVKENRDPEKLPAKILFKKKYTIDQLMTDLIERTQELNLYIRKDMADFEIEITSYITTLVNNYLFTGKFKRSK